MNFGANSSFISDTWRLLLGDFHFYQSNILIQYLLVKCNFWIIFTAFRKSHFGLNEVGKWTRFFFYLFIYFLFIVFQNPTDYMS